MTALPVRPPTAVGPAAFRGAILLAPLAVLPLAALVVVVLAVADRAGLPGLAGGLLAVGVMALGTRAFHWDGLSDTADGLTASHDPARSLAVMKTGTSGPAGSLAVVIVAGLQATGFGALAAAWGPWAGPLLGGLVVVLSRCALWLACAAPVPHAREDGLGAPFAGVVPTPVAGLALVLLGVLPGLVVAALVRRCVQRFGGVVGDVMGASVEAGCAGLVLVVVALGSVAG